MNRPGLKWTQEPLDYTDTHYLSTEKHRHFQHPE